MGGGKIQGLKSVVVAAACALMMASCSSTPSQKELVKASEGDQAAAMTASEGGDQKTAISFAKKEVARFSRPDQCSRTNVVNCGTLALAYGSLASYQILDGNRAAGEGSFSSAKEALSLTDVANRPSAIAMVYRDVSEAYWKTGDRARAIDVFNEGRFAGADKWLYMSSAARAALPPPTDQPPSDQSRTDQPSPDSRQTVDGSSVAPATPTRSVSPKAPGNAS